MGKHAGDKNYRRKANWREVAEYRVCCVCGNYIYGKFAEMRLTDMKSEERDTDRAICETCATEIQRAGAAPNWSEELADKCKQPNQQALRCPSCRGPIERTIAGACKEEIRFSCNHCHALWCWYDDRLERC